MENLLEFYKRTWWMWLVFIILFVVLALYVMPLFWFFIPGLIGYSIYFGAVRGSEISGKP
ncbi:MAG: hypothetical protein H7144_08440 [Burkholderiales bacterium]|nr:hypothetical protein [Phycisphaerae bacterium]